MELRALNPAAYNPRKDLKPGDRKFEEIKAAIQRFGLVEPLVWNSRTGNLVGGHQRLKVLLAEGVTEEDVSVVDLADAEERALNLALNNVGGEWDPERLQAILAEMEDLRGTGFDQEDQDAAHAAAEAEHVGDGKGLPSDALLRRVVLTFTVSGHTGYCCMAVASGLQYGTQSGRSVCGNTAPNRAHRLIFIDNDYFDYRHEVHLEAVAEHRPQFATTRDLMTERQCEAAGIEFYPFDVVMAQAEELAAAGAENVIVIPKYDCLADIPPQYVLGYSIPTSHGGTPLPFSRFKGRRIHLLGGSPQKQWAYFCEAPDDMATWGQWFCAERMEFRYIGETSPKPQSAMMAALTLSVRGICELFHRELREAAYVDRLTEELAANPSPLTRSLLGALGLSLTNVAELFHREPIDLAVRDLVARSRTEVATG